MKALISTAAAIAALLLVANSSADARPRHRHHVMMRASAPAPVEAAPQPTMFYPQDVDGGVSGNLPFNNQIRKHTDPLNANGGR